MKVYFNGRLHRRRNISKCIMALFLTFMMIFSSIGTAFAGTGNIGGGDDTSSPALITTVTNSTYEITFDVKAGASSIDGATIIVKNANGQEQVSQSGKYNLVNGEYTYSVSKASYATSEGFFTVNGDSMVVTVLLEEAGLLSELKITNGINATSALYNISPEFKAEDYNYTVTVPDTNTSFSVWATLSAAADSKSVITAKWVNTNGAEKTQTITSGNTKGQTLSMILKSGGPGNKVVIEVKSGDKTQNYVLNIVRTRSLSSLTASINSSNLTITPSFITGTYEYSAEVPESADSIYVMPTAYKTYSEGYSVRVCGEEAKEGEAKKVVLSGASTNIPIEVCHTDGSTGMYTLTVSRVSEAALTFKTMPEDAIIYLTDKNSNRIMPNSNGEYKLISGAEYTYVITRKGYVGQSYSFTAKAGEAEVILEKAAENISIDKTIKSEWASFRGNDENNCVVASKIPNTPDSATLYWAARYGEGWDTGAPSSPILVDGYVVFTSKTSIVKMDTTTGDIVASGNMVTTSAFNITPPTYADGMIFVALANGIVQAFNADTLESLWVYNDPLKGQPNSPITYNDGYIYTGFWNGEEKNANFVCLSATDEDPAKTNESKLATWTYTQLGGFYWAGAYACSSYVLVGTDDGQSGYISQTSNLLSFNPKTGEVIDTITSLDADIRSTISYDKATDRYYCASKGGSFYSFKVNSNGTFSKESFKELSLGGMSTSTPVIYNGRAYVGVSGTSQFAAYSGHNITVIDLVSWKIAYTCTTQGYPQTSGLLTTAYEGDSGYVYIYFVDNYTPGKIRIIKDKLGQTVMEEDKSIVYAPILFTPTGAQAQYAICSPIADEYGTLYFKNDSAHIMALGSKIMSIEITTKPEKLLYKEGESFDGTGMTVVAHLENGLSKDITKYVSYSTEALTHNDTDTTIEFSHVLYQDTYDGDNTNDSNNIGVEVTPLITAVDINVLSEMDYDSVINVMKLIDDIGDMTIDSKQVIKAARDAYDSLSEELKELVENYNKLTAAESELTVKEQAVEDVASLISAIGNVTLNSGDAISQAREAYNRLSDELKNKVANYSLLEDAEREFESISTVTLLINAVLPVGKDNIKEASINIQAALEAYNGLTEVQKSKILDYPVLEKAVQEISKLNHSVSDGKTVVSAEGLEWYMSLIIEQVTEEAKEKLSPEYGSSEMLVLYEVSIKNIITGETASVPENGIKLAFKVSNLSSYRNICILHLMENGTLEKITPQIDGEDVTFIVKSLSPIAIVGEKVKTESHNNVATGDESNCALMLGIMLSSAGVIILIGRKRRGVI